MQEEEFNTIYFAYLRTEMDKDFLKFIILILFIIFFLFVERLL
jgi:hypothetical protein